MDSELLRTFLEVSRTRHFGRAAESLYLTQSAVSFRIRQLETQLGTSLFTRHRNNIRLTAAGERLVPYAESLMNTWLQAKKEISHASQHTVLSIGATASLWESYLTNWLEVLYNQHDELRLEARVSTRQSLVKITTSAEITRQLLPVSLSAAFLPTHWLQHYPTLKTLSDNVITKPLYAIWLKKNDQQILINQLIKTPIPNTQ